MKKKTVVVDFDNTISININNELKGDFGNPNYPVINKMKEYKEKGYYIKVETARGHLSCKNKSERILKYYDKIKNFLIKYDVPFDEISFDKELVDVYIDDKSINVLDVENFDIFSGHSGNSIIRKDDFVYKIGNLKDEVEFYNYFENIKLENFSIPKMYFSSDTFSIIEYIKSEKIKKEDIITILDNFKKDMQNKNSYCNITLNDYLEIILERLELFKHYISKNLAKDIRNIITKIINSDISKFETKLCLTHGDFYLENILKKDEKFYLIDGLIKENKYSTFEFDVSKMYLMDYDFVQEEFEKYFGDDINVIRFYAILKFVSILKYWKHQSKIFEDIIKKFIKQINKGL